MATETRQARRGGFTLIELLVVVTIIAILIGIVAGAGVAVIGNQKVKQAEDLLASLDRALTEYMTENQDTPPPYIRPSYENTPGTGYAPGGGMNDMGNTDAWLDVNGNGLDDPRHPDAAVFLRQAQGVGAVDSILQGLGDRWLVPTPETGSTEPNAADGTPSVIDPWESPGDWRAPWPIIGVTTIYYVHPNNEAAESLYGQCLNGRPYFFSAGVDRIYGSTTHLNTSGQRDAALLDQAIEGLDDNIHSYEPGPADLSEDFNTSFR